MTVNSFLFFYNFRLQIWIKSSTNAVRLRIELLGELIEDELPPTYLRLGQRTSRSRKKVRFNDTNILNGIFLFRGKHYSG